LIELELTAAVYGGKVMGKHRGRPIFVPYALPGERITARITEDKRSYANAEGRHPAGSLPRPGAAAVPALRPAAAAAATSST
jgi:hypothetical protein